MASSSSRDQKISSSQWEAVKPEIARIYLDDDQPLKEVIERLRVKGFRATEEQYRYRFNKWGPRWKKNEKSKDHEALAIQLMRRKDEALNVYLWGEQIPQERITSIIRKNRPSTYELLDSSRNPLLPKGYTIRVRKHDLTQELTIRLPFHQLEDYLCEKALLCRPTDPRLLITQDSTKVLELRGILRQQKGSHSQLPENTDTSLTKLLEGSRLTLSSIFPSLDHTLSIEGSSFSNAHGGIFISPIHRQVLYSMANNLAGLEALTSERLIPLLKEVSSPDVFNLIIQSPRNLYATSIAQQVLRGAIEVGNAVLVDAILSRKQLEIDINEQTCIVHGRRMMALERAVQLPFGKVIEVMLHHGADVHKLHNHLPSHTHILSLVHCNCGSGVLDEALQPDFEHRRSPDTRLDPSIFRMILERSNYIGCRTLNYLIGHKEDEFVLCVILKYAETSCMQWIWDDIHVCHAMGSLLTQETTIRIVYKMIELGLSMKTEFLNAAAKGGHEELVQILLEKGVALNKRTLCDGIESRNERVVRMLLQSGASIHDDPESNDNVEGTENPFKRLSRRYERDPYSTAIRTRKFLIINMLIEKGALERLSQLKPWKMAWEAAVEVGDLKLVEQLMEMREDISPEELGHALCRVSKSGDYRMAVILLNRGAYIQFGSTSLDSSSALHDAIEAKNPALVKLLLDSGGDPNWMIHHSTPIQLAINYSNQELVEALILAGATSGIELHDAVKNKDQALMEMLVDYGAYIGHRCLETATRAGDFITSAWLLESGADPNNPQALENAFSSKSPFFKTLLQAHKKRYPTGRHGFISEALYSAIRKGDVAAVKCLLNHGGNPNSLLPGRDMETTLFFHAITFDGGRDTTFAKLLLDYGRGHKSFGCAPDSLVAKLEGSNPHTSFRGITALLAAIGTNSTSMVQLLLKEGGNINLPAVGRIRRTPLQRAAEIGNFEMVELCYNSGADVNSPPCRIGGATALQLAALGGFSRIVIYLLSHGADVDAPRALIDGRTALEGAAENGRIDTVWILLKAKAGNGGNDLPQFKRAIELADSQGHSAVSRLLNAHLRSLNL